MLPVPRSSVENVGGRAAVDLSSGLEVEEERWGVLSVPRKALRSGFVRTVRGISSRMVEKVSWWLINLQCTSEIGDRGSITEVQLKLVEEPEMNELTTGC